MNSETIITTLKIDDWNGLTDKTNIIKELENVVTSFKAAPLDDNLKLDAMRGRLYLLNRIILKIRSTSCRFRHE
jgi:hypothetical protein